MLTPTLSGSVPQPPATAGTSELLDRIEARLVALNPTGHTRHDSSISFRISHFDSMFRWRGMMMLDGGSLHISDPGEVTYELSCRRRFWAATVGVTAFILIMSVTTKSLMLLVILGSFSLLMSAADHLLWRSRARVFVDRLISNEAVPA